jgi:AcrR family transcriptional regulator
MATPTASRAPESRESWAGDPPLRGAARRRLIEAAARCAVRDGFAATSLSSVAAEAGVSRPTVYRYFADRHALLRATMLHAAGSLGDDLSRHLRAFRRDPRRMAVEAMLYVLGELPRNPLLAAMWGSTALDSALLADFTGAEVVAMARDALAELVEAAGWSDAEADEAVEWMLRVLLSLLVAPGPERSEAALRDLLERRMLPALRLPPNPSTNGET